MKVFRIRLDSNVYQSFLPFDSDIWQTQTLVMDCALKNDNWVAPKVYVHNPRKIKGNFFHLCSGAFVMDEQTTERLRSVLEMAGELLPVELDNSLYTLLNVVECVNCLDDLKTQWIIGNTTRARIRIRNYSFDKNRLSESTLFKIPETAKAEILCVQGLKDPEDEFKSQVEALGLKGLLFEPIWSDEE